MYSPSLAYRAAGGQFNVTEALEGVISSINPIYITFDNITNMTPSGVQNLLQFPKTPTRVVEFDTLQIIDDISIPTGRWNATNVPESITSTMLEWGTG